MSGGGGVKTVNTTQDTSPWSPQQPFLMQGMEEARRLYGSAGPEFYPGQTVANTTGSTQQAWDAGRGAATANAGLLNQTARGDFLREGNPYLAGIMGQVGNAIRPQIDSAFAGMGRTGSGAHANAFASALADQGTKLAYQNYGDERARMMAAATDYSPYQALMGFGGAEQAQNQSMLNDQAARWDFAQNQPFNKLANYWQIAGNGGLGGQSVTSQPYQSGSPLMQGIGAGISGLGALGQFGQAVPGLMKLFG